MSAGWYSSGVPFMPPSWLLLSGAVGVPPIRILKLPSRSNFRMKPSPPPLLVVHGVSFSPAFGGWGIAGDPDIIFLVDIDAVFDIRPDAAVFRLAFAADKAGIGRAAPGAQQFAAAIKFHDRGRRSATIRTETIGPHESKTIDRLTFGVGRTCDGGLKPHFIVVERAWPVVDPNMVVTIDIEAADLPQQPAMRQWLRPGRVNDEFGRLSGRRAVIDATLLLQEIEEGAFFARARVVGPNRGSQNA